MMIGFQKEMVATAYELKRYSSKILSQTNKKTE